MGPRIDSTIAEAERSLSKIASYPVIGTLAGLTKVLMGVAQTVSAIAYGIFASIAVGGEKDTEKLKWAGRHITHGLGNVAAGTLESIPIIQTILFAVRKRMARRNEETFVVYVSTGQEEKFMLYSSLLNERCAFKGACHKAVEKVRTAFNQSSLSQSPNKRYQNMVTLLNDLQPRELGEIF